MADTWTECKVGEQFGPHGGCQMRSPKYFSCGCDNGMCSKHGINMMFGPRWVTGTPKKCKKHSAKTEGK